MKNTIQMLSLKTLGMFGLVLISLLTACQSVPPAETKDIDSDVCVGEVVVVDPNKPIDLEEMAKQTDCP